MKHLVATLAALMVTAGCSTTIPDASLPLVSPAVQTPSNAAMELEVKWGVRVESLRLSAHGRMLDFRYRVLDPDKARLLTDRAKEAYLICEATGRRLKVPDMPKVGSLRSTTAFPEKNVIYVTLFANPGARVASGSRVTVEIGDFKAEHLVVE